MATTFYFVEGDTVNGEYELAGEMSADFEFAQCSLVFYSDNTKATVVKPSVGSAEITVSETGEVYGSIEGGKLSAAKVGPGATYDRPEFSGSITKAKIKMAGVVGAAYFKLTIARFTL